MTTADLGNHAINAELQIDQVQTHDATTATVAVHCIRGPFRLGARFHRILEAPEPIHLELTRILAYGRPIDELESVHTALVTLCGTGTGNLKSGDLASGWQVIQGSNPSG